MEYGKLLNRAWTIIWEHKFLICLGILVALGSSGISSGSRSLPQVDQEWRLPGPPEGDWSALPPARELGLPALPMYLGIVLLGIALIVALMVWVVSTVARGALIAGAATVDGGGMSSFGQAFTLAWRKGWTLLGIGVLPAIPGLILLLAVLGAVGVYVGMSPVIDRVGPLAGPRNVWIVLGALTCLALPVMLVLNLLRTFANRACMLEDSGVLVAYGRGFKLLGENLASALLLFLIQVGIGIALGLTLLLPALCCLVWPLLIVVQGTSAAYFSTMWTLVWRQWTGRAPIPGEAPAV